MNCESAQYHVLSASDGTTEAADPAVEAHMKTCPECRGFAQALAAMPEAELLDPPAALDRAVLAEAQRRVQRPPQPVAHRWFLVRPAMLRFAAAAAVALLIAGVALQRAAGPATSRRPIAGNPPPAPAGSPMPAEDAWEFDDFDEAMVAMEAQLEAAVGPPMADTTADTNGAAWEDRFERVIYEIEASAFLESSAI